MAETSKPTSPAPEPAPVPIVGSITWGVERKRSFQQYTSDLEKAEVTVLLPDGVRKEEAIELAKAVVKRMLGPDPQPNEAQSYPKAQTASPTASTPAARSTPPSQPAATPAYGPTASAANASPAARPAGQSFSSAGAKPTFLPDLQRSTCGNPSRPGCGKEIWWGKVTPRGEMKNHPYDADGTSHFKTCTQRSNFSSGGRGR